MARALLTETVFNAEIYSLCRLCWITLLEIPTHTFGEAKIKTSKISNLFTQ
jgi:hypothetical protein